MPGRTERARLEPVEREVHSVVRPGDVRLVVKAHMSDLRACYEHLGGDAGVAPRGELAVAWGIQTDGTVQNARIVTATPALASPSFEECILESVRQWKFPASRHTTEIASYPMAFGMTADAGSNAPSPAPKGAQP